jgi:excisionase family DNA binding protein
VELLPWPTICTERVADSHAQHLAVQHYDTHEAIRVSSKQQEGQQLSKTAGAMQRVAYSPTEAALVMGLSRNTIYELIGSGRLRSVKVGGRRLIPASAIMSLVEGEAA